MEAAKFARCLVSYATMDDDAMGRDTFIKRQDGLHSILVNDGNDQPMKIKLVQAIVKSKAIVSRSTTCYKTEDGHVAKFSWAPKKLKTEVETLKLAEEKGVQGVVRLVAHCQITDIATMRKGLQFLDAHRFRGVEVLSEDMPQATASSTFSGKKRKASSDPVTGKKPSPKKPRVLGQKSSGVQDVQSPNAGGSAASTEDTWNDRILSCLVVSPAGRVLTNFGTVRELLEVMRDAIKAHQSLYTTGGILHRDISPNNIIITDPAVSGGYRGMLIDLDMAKVLGSGRSGARNLTGTIQFMAVEVLQGADHTYRHDLESFLYVLLWMCARQSWHNGFPAQDEKAPPASYLRRWEIGSLYDLAANKQGDMTIGGVRRIMSEFPASLNGVKPLCLKLRSSLFGDTADLTLGTPAEDPTQLYASILAAYDDTIGIL
ncbi:hypothetical protein SEPCBS57363_003330 [Sporothrix epigloea]|uniref:EKC/KEOPS complex subunit BUD32 n=1 Tax=Sporothrix epigloea TaxID=1892477 RepID=A0ABP0DKY9_9PEZI